MALYTPLARLGTFLFPSHSRRISAPPPESPLPDFKRRSALASCESPPRCRRRLSFADHDNSISSSPSANPVLHARLNALLHSECGHAERVALWEEVRRLGVVKGVHKGLDDLLVRRVFESVFEEGGGGGGGKVGSDEFVVALEALEAVLEGGGVPLGRGDVSVVDGVLKGVVENLGEHHLVQTAARMVLKQDWARAFGELGMWARLGEALSQVVGREGVDLEEWEAGLSLLAACGEVVVGETEARGVVANLERLAEGDGESMERILRALYVLTADGGVARRFAEADLGRVVGEVSGVHARKVEVQHACVDLLVRLSSPRVWNHVPLV